MSIFLAFALFGYNWINWGNHYRAQVEKMWVVESREEIVEAIHMAFS